MSENISVERAADERIKRVADEAWNNLSVVLRVSMDEHSFKTGYMHASAHWITIIQTNHNKKGVSDDEIYWWLQVL